MPEEKSTIGTETECEYSGCSVRFKKKKENHRFHSEECRRLDFKEKYKLAMEKISTSEKDNP